MKVAYTHHAFTSQADGGISRYFYSLLRFDYNQGYSGVAYSPLYENKRLKLLRDGRVYGVCIGRIRPGSRRLISFANDLVSKHAIKAWGPDVVHQTYYSENPVQGNGAKVVLTVYDMIHEIYEGVYFRKNDRVIRAKEVSVKNADRIICISESTRRDLLKYYPECESKASVIYLGCDRASNDGEWASLQPLGDAPYLLCVGSRSGYKNFSSVLDAYASSKRLKKDFSLVSCSYEPFTEQEIQRINDRGIPREKIKRVEGDDQMLSSLYSNAAALVYPSLYEGFGLPPLEAMSLGCPVICSNTSSIPEIVGNAGKYFDPCDSESIRSAIEDVVYSDLERKTLIDGGYKRVKKFTWDACFSETINVYRSLV